MYFRLTERTAKGMRRVLVYNATVDSDLVSIMRCLGLGRYRVEVRDAKRQVVEAAAYVVTDRGEVWRDKPLRRRKARRVGPPRYVPRGTPPHHVPHAQVATVTYPSGGRSPAPGNHPLPRRQGPNR